MQHNKILINNSDFVLALSNSGLTSENEFGKGFSGLEFFMLNLLDQPSQAQNADKNHKLRSESRWLQEKTFHQTH